jgi:hypothetical protein
MNTRIPLTGMGPGKVAAEVRINADTDDAYGAVIFYSGCTVMQAYATVAQLRTIAHAATIAADRIELRAQVAA